MTRQSLEMLQKIAVYGGVIITLVGIAITFSSDMVGGCVALVGVAITCLGLVADYQLSKHQAAEKAADDARIADLEERLWQAEDRSQHHRSLLRHRPALQRSFLTRIPRMRR